MFRKLSFLSQFIMNVQLFVDKKKLKKICCFVCSVNNNKTQHLLMKKKREKEGRCDNNCLFCWFFVEKKKMSTICCFDWRLPYRSLSESVFFEFEILYILSICLVIIHL